MLQSDDSYTFDDYFSALKRRVPILIYVSLPIIVAALSLALLLPDSYESVARIDIDLQGANIETLEPLAVSRYADQYIAQLGDRILARNSLKRLSDDDSVFTGSVRELNGAERRRFLKDGIFVRLITQPVTTDSGRTVDLISGFLTGFKGPDAEFAHQVANFTAEAFLKEDRDLREGKTGATSKFLGEQISLTESQIRVLEAEVADFKVTNACCLPELKELNMSVIQRSERDIENLQPRIRVLENDRVFQQAQIDEIRKQSRSTDRLALLEEEYLTLVANYGPDHPDVARVRREIAAITNIGSLGEGSQELLDLRVELAEAERKYSPIHPDVVSLKRRIAALEADKPANAQKSRNRLLDNPRYLQLRAAVNNIDTELSSLRTRIPELRARIADHENRLVRTPQIESEYQALQRRLETARDSFDNLQERLVIARQTQALESTDVAARLTMVQAPAVQQSPVGPPRIAISILGIFLAVSLGIGSIVVIEMMDTTVRGSKDIARAIQMVPLAAIPVVKNSVSQAHNRRQMIVVMGSALVLIVAVVFVYTTAVSS